MIHSTNLVKGLEFLLERAKNSPAIQKAIEEATEEAAHSFVESIPEEYRSLAAPIMRSVASKLEVYNITKLTED